MGDLKDDNHGGGVHVHGVGFCESAPFVRVSVDGRQILPNAAAFASGPRIVGVVIKDGIVVDPGRLACPHVTKPGTLHFDGDNIELHGWNFDFDGGGGSMEVLALEYLLQRARKVARYALDGERE